MESLTNTIIGAAGLVSAVLVLLGGLVSIYKTARKWEKQTEEIQEIKNKQKDISEQQYLQLEVLDAVLDGLHQLHCNGKTTEAANKLDDYMKRKANGLKTEV